MADTNSEGAGTGYAVETNHGLSRVERGRGVRRGYLLINTAGEREDAAELTLWHWLGDVKAMRITDSEGDAVPYQVLDTGYYWEHEKKDLLVRCRVPAMGWRLIIVDEEDRKPVMSST